VIIVKSKKSKFNKKLLVEGITDFHVFSNLFLKHDVKHNFDIINDENYQGSGIYDSLSVWLKTENIDTIGIVVDADENADSKRDKIADILEKQGYVLNQKLDSTAIILKNELQPTIGIWVMPDNKNTGILEDFVEKLIPVNDALLPFVNQTLDNIEAKSLQQYKEKDKPKARMATWLAWQENPGDPIGVGINKQLFDTNHEYCQNFLTWIKDLFD
jgi:hypothetical protein